MYTYSQSFPQTQNDIVLERKRVKSSKKKREMSGEWWVIYAWNESKGALQSETLNRDWKCGVICWQNDEQETSEGETDSCSKDSRESQFNLTRGISTFLGLNHMDCIETESIVRNDPNICKPMKLIADSRTTIMIQQCSMELNSRDANTHLCVTIMNHYFTPHTIHKGL